MIVVITENTVKDRKKYLELAKEFVKDAKKDKGCQSMEVYISLENDDCVVFVSKWDLKKNFLEHVEGVSFAKHIPGMASYYVSGKDKFLELVS